MPYTPYVEVILLRYEHALYSYSCAKNCKKEEFF